MAEPKGRVSPKPSTQSSPPDSPQNIHEERFSNSDINTGKQTKANETPIEESTNLSDVISAPQSQDLARLNKAAVHQKLQQQKESTANKGTYAPISPPNPGAPESSLMQRSMHAGAASKMPDADIQRALQQGSRQKKEVAATQKESKRQKQKKTGLSPFKRAGFVGSPFSNNGAQNPLKKPLKVVRRISLIISLIGSFLSCIGCILPFLIIAGGAYIIASSLGIL